MDIPGKAAGFLKNIRGMVIMATISSSQQMESQQRDMAPQE